VAPIQVIGSSLCVVRLPLELPSPSCAFLNTVGDAGLLCRPIQARDDSGLQFASGSHRDFALPYWHQGLETFDLGSRGYALEDAGGLALGDVTWHAGWTLHYR
jgi:hypothetical protein